MKKALKIMAVATMACALSLSSISAKGSITKNGTVSEDIMINGKKVDKNNIKAEFKSVFENVSVKIVEEIEKLNNAPTKLSKLLDNKKVVLPADDGIKMENVAMLTSIQNLELIDKKTGLPIKDAKNVTMTWEVANLTKDAGVIRILHYSTVRDVWELLIPESVDYANKSVTVTFPDLSPVAVVYVPKEETANIKGIKNYGDGSKPNIIKIKNTVEVKEKTDYTPYYIAGITVLVIAGIGIFMTKRKVKE